MKNIKKRIPFTMRAKQMGAKKKSAVTPKTEGMADGGGKRINRDVTVPKPGALPKKVAKPHGSAKSKALKPSKMMAPHTKKKKEKAK